MAAPSRARKKHAKRSRNTLATNRQDLQALRDWLLPDAAIFATIALLGNSKWLSANLEWMALCWAWSDKRCVTDSFLEAIAACRQMLGVLPLCTCQGFMGALVTWTSRLALTAGPLEFQRTPARDRHGGSRPVPEKHLVLRRCGVRRLSVVVESRGLGG